jgi:hypothetical protein
VHLGRCGHSLTGFDSPEAEPHWFRALNRPRSARLGASGRPA